jgi:hypothetical protein
MTRIHGSYPKSLVTHTFIVCAWTQIFWTGHLQVYGHMQYMYAALWPTLRVTQHWQANAFTSLIEVLHTIGVEVLHSIGKPTRLPLSLWSFTPLALRCYTPLASQRVYLFHWGLAHHWQANAFTSFIVYPMPRQVLCTSLWSFLLGLKTMWGQTSGWLSMQGFALCLARLAMRQVKGT